MNATSTWLPILIGGPLGPPAKRGDMKDCNKNRVPWDSGEWRSINVVFKFVWIQDKSVSSDECQSMKHQHDAPIWAHRQQKWGKEGETEHYLRVRSHHTVRGRRLRVRRALGTRGTLWHCTKEREQGGRVSKKKCRRGAEKEARLLQGRRQSECKK